MAKGDGIQSVKPSELLQGESRQLKGINSDPDDLTILGTPFRVAVSDAIVDPGITVTRSIDEATFLTIPLEDPDGELRTSKLLASAFTLKLDGLRFRHAGIDRSDDGVLTLRPRSLEVAKLMGKRGRVKVTRGKWTRAEFIASLIDEVRPKIPFYCPELHTRQEIKDTREAREDEKERGGRRDRGLDSGAPLTVKGVKATAEQIKIADAMLRTAESLGASEEVMVGLITAAINESTIKNVSGGTSSSVGVLQLLDIHGTLEQRMDYVRSTKLFITKGFTGAGSAEDLAKRQPISEWLGLVMYSASGTPYPGLQYVGEAREWVDAFGGASTSSTEITRNKDYEFERKPNETTWGCMKRLGDEVNWRRFEANGIVYYIAETDLLDSQVRMRVSENAPGIDSISWNFDSGRKVQEVNISCRARAWAAPPGSVAFVSGEGELADGKYIVSEIESVLGDKSATVTLKRPTAPLPEPAPETVTKTIDFGGHHGNETAVASDNDAEGVETFDGKEVAAWIVPWLQKSRDAGWGGVVSSGYRTPEYSESLCFDMCGAPSCPGTCAGRSSNHSGKKYPAGAVDVTDFETFGRIQPEIGSPLKNDLPADRVHFSVSGH